jgi:polysaccharide biosynthesis protein PelF
MQITLISEGTYPHTLGGVSVWCDQLLRYLSEHRFQIVALTSTDSEPVRWDVPPSVSAVEIVPLWSGTLPARASRSLRRRFRPVQERFLLSLDVRSHGRGFVTALQELTEYAQAGQLSAAMSSIDALETLVACAPVCEERSADGERSSLTVADAADTLVVLEHLLRPLAVQPRESDLYHSVANGLGVLPALAAKWQRDIPLLLTEHGIYLRERYIWHKPGRQSQATRTLLLRFFRLLTETGYQQADMVVPCNKYNSLWELAGGTAPEKIFPVHNGIDVELFPMAGDEPEVPTLVWVGRVDPLKDLETLLRAFAEVLRAIPACRLRIFGPVPEGGEEYGRFCTNLAVELGLGSSVTFEGRADSPPVKAYHAGHLVLLTSISEGFPYSVIEAMATGRPVVATDVGGVSEAIGNTGVLVPPRDHRAVAAACVELLLDEPRRRALGADARRRVQRLFTVRQSLGAYRDLYQQLNDHRLAKVVPLIRLDERSRERELSLSSSDASA